MKAVVIGAAGRMGQRLVTLILNDERFELAGAIDIAAIGDDAGIVAGAGPCGVLISDTFATIVDNADVAIDFSAPTNAVQNARLAVAADCAVVIGTTGISEADRAQLQALGDSGGRIVFAPNMSIGVNLMFSLAAKVAQTLGADYDIEIVEMHHRHKVDAPSGTAEKLGQVVAEARGLDYTIDTCHGRQGIVGARTRDEIGMHALRGGDVIGEHHVIFAGDSERIELVHRASNRDVFANGALRAALFLSSASAGLYDMHDVLSLD